MTHLAILMLTDEALEELQRFIYITEHTTGLHPEFDPMHRVAIGVALSVERKERINIYSTKEIEGEKDV